MTRHLTLAAILVTSASQATAGTVKLINESWDSIPQVIVVEGINAPNSGVPHNYNNVGKGTIGTYTDRMCYKRTRNPSDPSSGLTDSWNCAQQLISGEYEEKF